MKKLIDRWLVNFITAAGGATALLAVPLAFRGAYRRALVLIGLATVIDAIDGFLVRSLELQEILPAFDGERLDEYADLLTFVVAPLGFGWASGLLAFNYAGLLTTIFVAGASCLQFADCRAKQANAFRGWPAYWNIFFFYAWGLNFSPELTMTLCWLLGFGAFLPVYFIYPSRFKTLRKTTVLFGLVWGAVLLYYLLNPAAPRWLLYLSLLYPAYYFGLGLLYYPELAS